MTINLIQMLQPGGIVPIDIPTTAALVAEVQRLRDEVEADNRNLCQLTDEVAQCRREIERLRKAATAVVARWHSPLWADLPHTADCIKALGDALGDKT